MTIGDDPGWNGNEGRDGQNSLTSPGLASNTTPIRFSFLGVDQTCHGVRDISCIGD